MWMPIPPRCATCAFGPAGTTPQMILSATLDAFGSTRPAWKANQLIACATWPCAIALLTSSNHQFPDPGGEILYSFCIHCSAPTPASLLIKPSVLALPSHNSPPHDHRI